MRRIKAQLAFSAAAATLMFASTAASPNLANAQDRVSGQRASISAQGRATIRQDRGWVEFFIVAEAKTPAEAFAQHAASLSATLEQIAAKGHAGGSVQPGLLAIRPRYEVKREGNREIRGPLVGYLVTKPVFVFVDDPARVADLVASFPLSGPIRIGNVGFFASDAKAANDGAIADAVKRAQAAGAIAAGATNRRIGSVSGVTLHLLNDRTGSRPEPRTLQSWQNQPSPNTVDSNEMTSRLVLEPGEEKAQQQVTLELQLR